MKVVVELWHLQLLKRDIGRIEGETDGVGKLCVHQQRDLKGNMDGKIKKPNKVTFFVSLVVHSQPPPDPEAWPGSF